LILLSSITVLFSFAVMITSIKMTFKPPNYRLTNSSPATTCWLSILLFLDSLHFVLGASLYRVPFEAVRWLLAAKFVLVMSIIKFVMYFISGVCLAANPVPDVVGSATAFIGSLISLTLIWVRWEFLKNESLDKNLKKLINEDQYRFNANEENEDS
jgi:hypothetical protein